MRDEADPSTPTALLRQFINWERISARPYSDDADDYLSSSYAACSAYDAHLSSSVGLDSYVACSASSANLSSSASASVALDAHTERFLLMS